MPKVGETTIAGVEVEIHATTSAGGRWEIHKGGQCIGRNSVLEGAERSAAAAIRKAKIKVSVPFFTPEGEVGEATGIHAGNGSVLAKVGGEAMQISYGPRQLRGDMPAEAVDALDAALRKEREGFREAKALRDRYQFDLRAAVEREIAEATADGEAPA